MTDLSKMSDSELDAYIARKQKEETAAPPATSKPVDLSKMSESELDAYIDRKQKEEKEPGFFEDKLKDAETFLRSAGNSAAFGYIPQINAALDPLIYRLSGEKAVDDKLRAQGFKIPEHQSYTEARDKEAADLAKLQSEHPISSAAGTVTGIVGGPGGLIGKGVMKALPAAATVLGTIGRAGAIGAAEAGLMNPGETEGEVSPLQLGERAKAAGLGALGGIGGAAIAEYLPRLSKTLSKFAEQRAVKALGPMKKDIEILAKTRGGSPERVGRTLLDEGIIGNVPVSQGKLAQRIEPALEQSGKKIGELVDEIGALPGAEDAISRSEIGSKIRKELIHPLKGAIGSEEQIAKLDDLISRFESQGEEALSLKDAEKMKRLYQDLVKHDRRVNAAQPIIEKFQDQTARQLRKGVEESGQQLAEKAGTPELAKAFKAEKNRFADLSSSADILSRAENNELARRFISPSDYASGGIAAAGKLAAGASSGGALSLGAVAATVNNLARKYGSQISAKQADNVARLITKNNKIRRAFLDNPGKVLAAYSKMANGIAGEVNDYFSPGEFRGESLPVTDSYISPQDAADQFINNQ